MEFVSRRQVVSLAPLLAVPTSFLRVASGRAQANPPAKPIPAAKPIIVDMAEFTAKTRDPDLAFEQALASVEKLASQAKTRGAPAPSVLNLEKSAIYKIKRPIEVTQFDSFEISGNGAQLINTALQTTLHIRSCGHVTIRDLSIDYDPLPFTQGVIAAFDAKALQITVKVDRGYPDDAKFLATARDGVFCVMNRQTRSLKAGARNFLSPSGIDRLGPGVIRVHLQWSANDCGPGQLPIVVGDVVVICGGSAHAIVVENCTATAFASLDLRASPGMGILENAGPGGTTLQHVTVAPGPRPAGAVTDRLVSTNSDGSHFIAVERGPLLDGCNFSNTMDDAVNVHGFYFFVLRKTGPRAYLLSPKWDVGLMQGDEVESCVNGSFASVGQSKLTQLKKRQAPELKGLIAQVWKGKSATTLPDTVYEVELQADLPLKFGDALTSLSRIGTGTVVRNSSFHACGRVMVKSPDSLIENNQFSYSGDVAVQAGSDIGFWAESDFARNLTIRNNHFTRCMLGANELFPDGSALATIYIGMTPPQDAKGFEKNFGNQGVTIEGNTIADSYIYAIFVTNTDGLKIIGNTIGQTFVRGHAFAAGQFYGVTPASGIFIGMTKDAQISNNTGAKGAIARTPVVVDRTCPTNTIRVQNNRLG